MSHTTTIDSVVFSDIDALKAAVAELQKSGVKCSLLVNAVPRAYYANQQGMGEAPFVLKLDDSRFDVGFYYDKDKKGYTPRTDLFGNHVANVLGAKKTQDHETPMQCALGKLNQMYGVHAATRQAVKQGYSVRRSTKPDGTVQLTMIVPD